MEVAGVVAIDVQLESLRQHVGCYPLALGVDRLLTGGGERAPDDLGLLGEPVGRKIVEQPVTVPAEVDGGERAEGGDVADEVVGDLVDAHPVRR